MAELTLTQHLELAGAITPESHFNGWQSSGLYLPAKDTQVGGYHAAAMLNMIDSLARPLGNVCQARVYRDADDEDDEFSVRAFDHRHDGLIGTYAGATALGPLATGANLIWADLSAMPTISIGVGASWPAVPFLPLASVTQPAAAPWMPADLAAKVAMAAAATGNGKFRKRLTFANTGVNNVVVVPAGAVIFWTLIVITEAFNGSTPTIKVGDAVDDDRLVESADVTLGSLGDDYIQRPHVYAAQTQITATLTIGGSPTTGEVWILGEAW